MNTTGYFAKHIIAVRIYFADGLCTPYVDLKFSDGVMETIEWVNIKQRNTYRLGKFAQKVLQESGADYDTELYPINI